MLKTVQSETAIIMASIFSAVQVVQTVHMDVNGVMCEGSVWMQLTQSAHSR